MVVALTAAPACLTTLRGGSSCSTGGARTRRSALACVAPARPVLSSLQRAATLPVRAVSNTGVTIRRMARPGPLAAPPGSPVSQREEQTSLLARSTERTGSSGSSTGGGGGDDGGGGGSNKAVAALGLAGAAVLLLVGLKASGFDVQAAVKDLEDLISQSGYLGPLVFIAAYAAATVLLFPASLLTLGAGYLFGPLAGTAVVSAASTTGATLAFLISRYAARPFVEDRLKQYPKFGAVDAAIAREGAKVVVLLRLSPLFPFNLLNYFLGATSIELLPYVAASWAGMLPGTFAYVFLGSAGRAAGDAAAGGGGGGGAKWVLYAVGAVATILVTRVISQAAAKALEGEAAAGGDGGGSGEGGQ